MRPLAIIERDASFGVHLLRTIESAGLRAAVFTSAKAALPLLREQHFALALIGLAADDADPFMLFREASPFTPMIAVARRCAGDEGCMRALESGADDCICRDIGSRELIARIRGLLRRAEQAPADRGELATVVSEMRVRFEDRVQNLTAGETAVLTALLERAPAPMTILEIAHAIGAKRGTVEARIKGLRRKLGPERLVSRGRFGYQVE